MNTTVFKREKKERQYSVIDNTILKDNRLSAKAKWIFCYLLSLPDDWIINIVELKNHFTDWRESIYNWIKELEKFWYFIRNQVRNENWQIVWVEYLIIEKPEVLAQSSLGTGFPNTVKPNTDNQQLLNTNNNKVLKEQSIPTPSSPADEKDNKKEIELTADEIYRYYLSAFPNKKWHWRKLAIERIKKLLKTNTKEQILSAVDSYKKDKRDTIAKQEWIFIKTADTFFWFERWTRIEFIDRYLSNQEPVKQQVKKELVKEDLDFLNDESYNI